MKESNFYDAAWGRLVALKSYKLISPSSKSFRLSRRGVEFLKHEDKEYYLGKILLSDKYKRTKYPEVFIEVLKIYTSLTPMMRKSVKKIVLKENSAELWEDLNEKDFDRWFKFVDKVHERFPAIPKDTISKICDSSLRSATIGTKSPIEIPVKKLKKIIEELEEIQHYSAQTSQPKRVRSFVVENLLELHLEDLLRRNISKIFPNFEIVDGNQHYYTKDGNYIDILCKDRSDGGIVIIELKRDRSPSTALVQLLDYMNQIMEEFNTKNIRGILVCRKIDRKTKSALQAIRKKLKNPDDVNVLEFDLKFTAYYF